jgi:mono/diheme cytochrome c family protein
MRHARTILGILLGLGALAVAPAPPRAQDDALSSSRIDDWWDPVIRRRDEWRPGAMGPQQRDRMDRHWAWMTDSVPPPYRGLQNPVAEDRQAIADGAALYARDCAGCHGSDGFGNGDIGLALDPSPALLSFMVRMPQAVDEYLMWSIAEGGLPFGSDMPAYKDRLSVDEIWRIVAFMRAGFPEDAAPR